MPDGQETRAAMIEQTVSLRQAVAAEGEVRVTDPVTGGAKGSKLARFDLLPWDALWQVAEMFGRGARKYADRNWEKGYSWGLSHAALGRHFAAYMMGEDYDAHLPTCPADCVEHTEGLHIVAVAWHALVLVAFKLRGRGTDSRTDQGGTA